jgi:branched-chain amino acid transport system permease protein
MRAGVRALALVLLALAGCGPDPAQVAACRSIAEALAPPPIDRLEIESAETSIVLRFAAGAAREPHRLACDFAGDRLSALRLTLAAAALDGVPVPESALVLLGRVAGFDTAVPPEAAPPPAAALAYLVQQLVNGLTLGALLALVATGYSLVYGITGSIQFAYGEMFMIGAVTTAVVFAALEAVGLPRIALALPLAVIVAGGATALYGWTAERLMFRPLTFRGAGRADRLAALIAAIGLAIALREYVRLAQGARDKWLPPLFAARRTLFEQHGFAVLVGDLQLAALGLAALLGAGLAWALGATRWGRAHRACAEDPQMAALLGVATDRVVSTAFTLGAALAALAGAMIAVRYGEADFSMGYLVGFKALTAALLGGFGSLAGACLGGLLIGLFETLWSAYAGFAYKDAAVFAVLVLVLVFRPHGLLGAAAAPLPHDRIR